MRISTEKRLSESKVTLVELANRLNVSTTTVSKALRGLPGIGEDTVKRVKELAKQMGYRPNIFAQGLKTASSITVGVLVTSDIVYPWYAQFVSKLEEKLSERGYTVTLGLGKNNSLKESSCLESFRGGHVAGVIAGPVFHQQDLSPLWDFCNNGPPMILFSCLDDMPVSYVGIDHIAGAKKAVNYLIETGHRRIGYLCCPSPVVRQPGRTRKEGFEQAMFENDLPLIGRDIIISEPTVEAGFSAMFNLLSTRKDDLPSAFFCHNDSAAIGAIRAIQKVGLSVPDDISLVGYDDITEASYSNPPLTTIGGIMDKLVERLIDVLMKKIEDRDSQLIREKIEPVLIERESVKRKNL